MWNRFIDPAKNKQKLNYWCSKMGKIQVEVPGLQGFKPRFVILWTAVLIATNFHVLSRSDKRNSAEYLKNSPVNGIVRTDMFLWNLYFPQIDIFWKNILGYLGELFIFLSFDQVNFDS